jgi:hypothetical protein
MLTLECMALLRLYADEPDQTFLNNTQVATFCRMGYDQFRNFVAEINPYALGQTINITLANQRTYDLTQANALNTVATTPSLLGTNPNTATVPNGRLTRLLSVVQLSGDGTGQIIQIYPLVENNEAMVAGNYCVKWQNEQLIFPWNITGLFQLQYTAEQTVGLANPVVANNHPSWIAVTSPYTLVNAAIPDNFNQWHDLIPLFAYEQYAITNAMENPAVIRRMQERKTEFRNYLMERSFGAVHYVHQNVDPNGVGGNYLI